eukprot:CAMPEP_0194400308 /NCGR_PEP_ID=MMETSP0174-20130528/127139_1 /TAXON_ID=216777 /ORGANISM="Proboscia alata, Strain PI-D3" /LENGTH=46 /DNA_ID= /DNA_START= /DNA_END= /DNA_ORIENTATION=
MTMSWNGSLPVSQRRGVIRMGMCPAVMTDVDLVNVCVERTDFRGRV